MDIEDMTGERPGVYWQTCWRFVSPLVMFTILVASLVFRFMNRPTYLAWDRHAVRLADCMAASASAHIPIPTWYPPVPTYPKHLP